MFPQSDKQSFYQSAKWSGTGLCALLKVGWVPGSEKTVSKSTLSNNMSLWTHHKVALLYSEQKEEMRKEMRSEGSDRKWVLFVICGTRYFIKPVYVRDILYMLQGIWDLRKRVHKYEKTTWHDSKKACNYPFPQWGPKTDETAHACRQRYDIQYMYIS